MELIDKSALVAEIEKRTKEHHSGYLVCLKDILSFLDTLEVKEMDLEKEKEYTCYEEAFEDGCKWQKEQMIKDTVERVKKEMITRAIAWVEWNNRNGSCLFDGWKESLIKAMEEL